MIEKPLRSETSTWRFSRKWRRIAFSALGLAVILVSIFIVYPLQRATHPAHASGGDWSTYMFNVGRSGYNKSETVINRTSAPNLKVHWTAQGGGSIFSQPVVANGMIYWGTFDGYEHASNLSGQQVWQQNLGNRTTCAPVTPLGVVGTAAVASVSINGQMTSVVFVGGGDDHLYALNAANGSVIWSTPVGNPSTNTFIWDSPLVYNNNVYIGIATTGESSGCKLVAGAFYQLNASTGSIESTYNTVPAGCVGAGVWASPTFDTSDGSVYITTGTEGHCTKTDAIGLVKLRLSDLSYKSSWVIPLNQRVNDSDFGATPTLFTATIGGTLHKMVGVVNKNGTYYAFDRTAVSSGPLWTANIAVGGTCPQCGQGSISSSVFDDTDLYVAGGSTTINGSSCKGSLRALSPVDGSFTWQDCLSGTVMGAVTVVPGVVAVVDGHALTLVDAKTGAILFNDNTTAKFYGSPSISNGVLYIGSSTNQLTAFGT